MSEPFGNSGEERTLSAVGRALPRVPVPEDLFTRIVAVTEREAPAAVHVRRHTAVPRFGLALAAAALAAAAAVAITIGVRSGNGPGHPAASARIAAHLASVHVEGQAALYRPTTSNGVLRLRLRDVPGPPRGSHYEVWVLRRGSTEMTAVGSFTPTKPTVTLSLPLPTAGDYAAVDISIQKNDGPPEHSNVSLAGASF
jgi:Anti-sigma-K factor rskA